MVYQASRHTTEAMKQVLAETYKKYGYRMFDCTKEQLIRYNHDECYMQKRPSNPSEKFNYVTFEDVDDAVKRINSVFIPMSHGELPKVQWSLHDNNRLLIKEIWFYESKDQDLYQQSVERAWALNGHLDVRVEQQYYD